MIAKLLVLMTVIPAVELYLLLKLGQWMGPVETVVLIAATGALGATLAKREGIGVLRQLAADARNGIPPADRLVEGVLVLLGGVLLITPGVLTDLTGLVLMLGPTRRWLAPRIKQALASRVGLVAGLNVGAPAWGPASGAANVEPGAGAAPRSAGAHFEHPTR